MSDPRTKRDLRIEEIGDDILPQSIIDGVLKRPTLDSQGRIVSAGPWSGLTPDEVLRERDAFRRACGE